MNRSEFLEIHEQCVIAMRAYFVEAEKMSAMLADCTAEPMPFRDRFRLMSQGIVENDAHLIYLSAKSLLFSTARLGYGSSN